MRPTGARRLTIVFALLAAACGGGGRDPVAARLALLEEAVEARDADAFGEGLSPRFHGGGFDRAAAVQELRRYLTLYETASLTVHGVEVDRREGRAEVRCIVEFSGRAKTLGGLDQLLPPEAAYRFRLEMAAEAGTWRVEAASWDAAAPTPPAS
jgi:hypothetical protein